MSCEKVNQDLFAATIEHDEKEVLRCIEAGANVNMRGHQGATPLHRAVAWSNEAVVNILLANNADPNLKTNTGLTVLHIAAFHGKTNMVQPIIYQSLKLVDEATKKSDVVDARDNDGRTPMYYALECGNSEAANILRENGASLDFCGNSRSSIAPANFQESGGISPLSIQQQNKEKRRY